MLERWRRRAAPIPADDLAALAGSGLFDPLFYERCNRDVAAAGLPPLGHFGWREGRRPNPLFDPAWYARTHRTGANENPLVHYLRRGERAGLRPISFFDPGRHRRWRGVPRRCSALAHYLAGRTAPTSAAALVENETVVGFDVDEDADTAVVAASGLFDSSLYLVEGPDIRAAGWEPLAHYRRWGFREGRRPNLYFDPAWYRARHLGGAVIDPLVHYIRRGEERGLRPIATFDPAWYRRRYELATGTSPLAHFLANRRAQRVAPNPDFDLAFHMKNRGATLGPNRDPFAHYLLEGLTRDLDPLPGFDAAANRAEVMASEAAIPTAVGPAAWARAERQVPLVHFLDAFP